MNDYRKFPWRPRPGPSINSAPQVVSATFGDGYEEVRDAGINNDLKTYQITVRVPISEKMRVNDFLNYHGASKAFMIYSDSRLKDVLVRLTTWSETPYTGSNYTDFSINFKEVVL